MATQSSVLLQFQRADARAEFERSRREVKNSLLDHGAEIAATRLMELANALDTGVTRMKRELLGSSLCWNDENQQIAKWISQQHRSLAEMATRVADELRGGDRNLQRQVVALTFFQAGEALKWTAARERSDYAPLHRTFEEMSSGDRHRETFSWVAEGRGRTTTIEALYFRALLLDRFTSGSLTASQVAILDAWVWEWMDALKGERNYTGADVLRVDLDSSAGLRDGKREGEGATLYLPLAPLEAARRKIVTDLHRGRVTPPHGWVSELRVEEHINVLDHLRNAFRATASNAPPRARRTPAGGTRLEIWVGLQEILSRGIGVGTETGRYRALNLADAATAPQSTARFGDSTRRYLWLVDASASGLGFEGLECDAAGIEVGDLLGWRNITGGPVILARVMRRMPSATSGQVFLGVQTLTEAAQPLKLSQVVSFDNGNSNGTYLFVPGSDESGQHDAFLVSDKTYELQASYNTHVGNDAFTLKFNRVRNKGRGWILAGFEILPAPQRATAAATITEAARDFDFRLELIEDNSDPFEREVSRRLS